LRYLADPIFFAHSTYTRAHRACEKSQNSSIFQKISISNKNIKV